jgi:hypothetical protein
MDYYDSHSIYSSGCYSRLVERDPMKLYDLPQRLEPGKRPKIYDIVNGEPEYIEFDHLDGMYSYCVVYTAEGEKLGLCHLAGFTPLVPFEDGYKIAPEGGETDD